MFNYYFCYNCYFFLFIFYFHYHILITSYHLFLLVFCIIIVVALRFIYLFIHFLKIWIYYFILSLFLFCVYLFLFYFLFIFILYYFFFIGYFLLIVSVVFVFCFLCFWLSWACGEIWALDFITLNLVKYNCLRWALFSPKTKKHWVETWLFIFAYFDFYYLTKMQLFQTFSNNMHKLQKHSLPKSRFWKLDRSMNQCLYQFKSQWSNCSWIGLL